MAELEKTVDPRYMTIAPTSLTGVELRCEGCKEVVLAWEFEEFKDDRLAVFEIVRESLRHACSKESDNGMADNSRVPELLSEQHGSDQERRDGSDSSPDA